jgi:long-chain acyl-CoA synthetase
MDKLVWGSIRNTALGGIAGDALRAVIVVGGKPFLLTPMSLTTAPSQTDVALSHALLSLPLTRLHTSFVSAGPVFVSHFYDLQGPPVDMFRRKLDNDTAHSGPPASNVEVILRGPKTELADNDDPAKPLEGRLWIRGPGVVEPIGVKSKDSFVNTADDAAVLTNGCFIIGA